MTEILDVLVVGAGISGLSLAHKLTKLSNDSPLKILVAESQNRVGGNITTVSQGEFLWETVAVSYTHLTLPTNLSV